MPNFGSRPSSQRGGIPRHVCSSEVRQGRLGEQQRLSLSSTIAQENDSRQTLSLPSISPTARPASGSGAITITQHEKHINNSNSILVRPSSSTLVITGEGVLPLSRLTSADNNSRSHSRSGAMASPTKRHTPSASGSRKHSKQQGSGGSRPGTRDKADAVCTSQRVGGTQLTSSSSGGGGEAHSPAVFPSGTIPLKEMAQQARKKAFESSSKGHSPSPCYPLADKPKEFIKKYFQSHKSPPSSTRRTTDSQPAIIPSTPRDLLPGAVSLDGAATPRTTSSVQSMSRQTSSNVMGSTTTTTNNMKGRKAGSENAPKRSALTGTLEGTTCVLKRTYRGVTTALYDDGHVETWSEDRAGARIAGNVPKRNKSKSPSSGRTTPRDQATPSNDIAESTPLPLPPIIATTTDSSSSVAKQTVGYVPSGFGVAESHARRGTEQSIMGSSVVSRDSRSPSTRRNTMEVQPQQDRNRSFIAELEARARTPSRATSIFHRSSTATRPPSPATVVFENEGGPLDDSSQDSWEGEEGDEELKFRKDNEEVFAVVEDSDSGAPPISIELMVANRRMAQKEAIIKPERPDAKSLLSISLPVVAEDGTLKNPTCLPCGWLVYDLFRRIVDRERGAMRSRLTGLDVNRFMNHTTEASEFTVLFFWSVVFRFRRVWVEGLLIGRYERLSAAYQELFVGQSNRKLMTLPTLEEIEGILVELMHCEYTVARQTHERRRRFSRTGTGTLSENGSIDLVAMAHEKEYYYLQTHLSEVLRSGFIPDTASIDGLARAFDLLNAAIKEHAQLIEYEERAYHQLAILFGQIFLNLKATEKDLILESYTFIVAHLTYFTLVYCFPNDDHAGFFHADFRADLYRALQYWCSGLVVTHVPVKNWPTPTVEDRAEMPKYVLPKRNSHESVNYDPSTTTASVGSTAFLSGDHHRDSSDGKPLRGVGRLSIRDLNSVVLGAQPVSSPSSDVKGVGVFDIGGFGPVSPSLEQARRKSRAVSLAFKEVEHLRADFSVTHGYAEMDKARRQLQRENRSVSVMPVDSLGTRLHTVSPEKQLTQRRGSRLFAPTPNALENSAASDKNTPKRRGSRSFILTPSNIKDNPITCISPDKPSIQRRGSRMFVSTPSNVKDGNLIAAEHNPFKPNTAGMDGPHVTATNVVRQATVMPYDDTSGFQDVDTSVANGQHTLATAFFDFTKHAEKLVGELEKRTTRQHRTQMRKLRHAQKQQQIQTLQMEALTAAGEESPAPTARMRNRLMSRMKASPRPSHLTIPDMLNSEDVDTLSVFSKVVNVKAPFSPPTMHAAILPPELPAVLPMDNPVVNSAMRNRSTVGLSTTASTIFAIMSQQQQQNQSTYAASHVSHTSHQSNQDNNNTQTGALPKITKHQRRQLALEEHRAHLKTRERPLEGDNLENIAERLKKQRGRREKKPFAPVSSSQQNGSKDGKAQSKDDADDGDEESEDEFTPQMILHPTVKMPNAELLSFLSLYPLAECEPEVRRYLVGVVGMRFAEVPLPIMNSAASAAASLIIRQQRDRKRAAAAQKKAMDAFGMSTNTAVSECQSGGGHPLHNESFHSSHLKIRAGDPPERAPKFTEGPQRMLLPTASPFIIHYAAAKLDLELDKGTGEIAIRTPLPQLDPVPIEMQDGIMTKILDRFALNEECVAAERYDTDAPPTATFVTAVPATLPTHIGPFSVDRFRENILGVAKTESESSKSKKKLRSTGRRTNNSSSCKESQHSGRSTPVSTRGPSSTCSSAAHYNKLHSNHRTNTFRGIGRAATQNTHVLVLPREDGLPRPVLYNKLRHEALKRQEALMHDMDMIAHRDTISRKGYINEHLRAVSDQHRTQSEPMMRKYLKMAREKLELREGLMFQDDDTESRLGTTTAKGSMASMYQ